MIKNYQKLAIGTAQFGMPYGIANMTGQIELDQGRKILELAMQSGIHTIDTAIGYGESEEQLGKIGLNGWEVITKVLPMPTERIDPKKWIQESFYASIERLQVESLYGFLFHVPDQLLGKNGAELYSALYKLKEQGLVKKIGVSIYIPEQLERLFAEFDFDLVQVPFSIIDRRIESSGWLARLASKKVEVHIRSVFLQGLLLMPTEQKPAKFKKWVGLWQDFDNWLLETKLSPLQACLNFVLNHPLIDKAVVGVDSVENIREIITNADRDIPEVPSYLNCNDTDLINPALW